MTERGAILVTGGAGYIGSHACKALAAAGYLPVTLDNLSTGHREAVRWGPLQVGDVGDEAAVKALVAAHGVRSAMHFAAFSQVGESMRDPLRYFDNNVGAGTRLVRALIDSGVDTLVFSSTAAVYGLPEAVPVEETAPPAPINPYGASKLAFETLLGWLGGAGQMRSAVLRYFNAAGADEDGEIGEDHEPETHLIPLVCRAALGGGEPVTVFGQDYPTPDGTALRDYVHVTDLAEAHVAALEWLLAGGESRTWNLGGQQATSVRQVIDAVERVLGRPVPHRLGDRRPGDPPALVASIAAIERDLGWRPSRDLDAMVATAGRWHAARRS
jgi:UDP-glucose-4-epimerase GalE